MTGDRPAPEGLRGGSRGYAVSFNRIDKNRDDRTDVYQTISRYPPETMNRIFLTEKEAARTGNSMGVMLYEIPFPKIGDDSIAIRQITPGDTESPTTYSVLFRKKNVIEIITMSGTTTDYELLKKIALTSEDRIP